MPSVAEFMVDVDAVVMPSLWEAAPLLAMEALTAGCPLVASDGIGLREVVGDAPAIVVQPGDARALTDAMSLVINDQQLLEQRARDYAAVAASRFDSRRTASALHSVFTEITPKLD
jgi:glycosyltransferase involved in cell wall biosynthesis